MLTKQTHNSPVDYREKYYHYTGINTYGLHVEGQIKATNIVTLRHLLAVKHIHLTTAQVIPSFHGLQAFFKYRSITTKVIIEWCFQLHLLLKSGITVADAVSFMTEQKLVPAMTSVSQQIQLALTQGHLLSSILKQFPYCFDNIFISLIQIGEKTGCLNACLDHLLMYLNWQQKLKEQIGRALIYPLLLLAMTSLILSVLLAVLIPQMQQLLTQQHHELPAATRLLITTSTFFENHALAMVISTICFYFTIKLVALYSHRFKNMIDRFKLFYPKIGHLLYMIETERFIFTVKILYQSGIGIITCLEQAQYSLKNLWLKSKLQLVTARIIKGEILSQALIHEHVFDTYLSKIVAIGEKSGHLDTALDHANRYYAQNLQRRFDMIAALIGPMCILVIGSMLIWITLAMFVPIYDHLAVIL